VPPNFNLVRFSTSLTFDGVGGMKLREVETGVGVMDIDMSLVRPSMAIGKIGLWAGLSGRMYNLLKSIFREQCGTSAK